MNERDIKIVHAVINARVLGFLKWVGPFFVGLVFQAGVMWVWHAEVTDRVESLETTVACLSSKVKKGECAR